MRRPWLAMLAAQVLLGQTAFDVATIKPSDPQSPVVSGTGFSPRRFSGTGTLRSFIQTAFGVQDSQISGGPGWLGSDRFNIDARTEQAATPDQMRAMLQVLLTDRFNLAVHRESRQTPVYALVAGKNGVKLRAAEGPGGVSSGPGMIRGQFSMADLARYLSLTAGRMVIDRTGLAGNFEAKLEWKADEESIFTAIQEQLGLRLESTKAAVDVLVIDRAERPSEN